MDNLVSMVEFYSFTSLDQGCGGGCRPTERHEVSADTNIGDYFLHISRGVHTRVIGR
jgi:hypothetical protein